MTALSNYIEYVEKHRRYVLEEAIKLHIPDRGVKHDLSKFEPDEIYDYAEYFYGGYDRNNMPSDVQAAFDEAWLRHQKRNDHHWQYWVLLKDDGTTTALQMPEDAMREMLADWHGAGRAILGEQANTRAWFEKNRSKMLLHPRTIKWLEAYL